MKKYAWVFCLAIILGCNTVNSNFVVAVDDALDVILPRYVHYVSIDTELGADDIRIIIDSTNELKSMVKEELKRHEK